MNWKETVNHTKSQNPGVYFKEVLKKAGETYRKGDKTNKGEKTAEAYRNKGEKTAEAYRNEAKTKDAKRK